MLAAGQITGWTFAASRAAEERKTAVIRNPESDSDDDNQRCRAGCGYFDFSHHPSPPPGRIIWKYELAEFEFHLVGTTAHRGCCCELSTR
jgi:hypothetical protein